MNSVEISIMNETGLHARPATQFVKISNNFQSEVSVIKGERKVNGKSIMGLMSLAISKGSIIRIEAEGPDEQQVIKSLVNFIEYKLDD
ncbi:HPr family phosphocarrier protein [Priestia sp. YIM B13490]|uniref:HPr family phosphocarrier protein n=1 Tax=Priestia sp. YIM B13490 TaxID=3366310 RepID=UPI00366F771C